MTTQYVNLPQQSISLRIDTNVVNGIAYVTNVEVDDTELKIILTDLQNRITTLENKEN